MKDRWVVLYMTTPVGRSNGRENRSPLLSDVTMTRLPQLDNETSHHRLTVHHNVNCEASSSSRNHIINVQTEHC